MKKHKILRFCLLMAAAVAVSGCQKTKEDEKPIVVSLYDDIVSLDVAGTKDILSETVGRCVFSTLYTFDENLNLVPCLAEKAEHVSDLEWDITLKKGVKFHDGSPLTASDVVFSFNRAIAAKNADQSLLAIDKIEAADDTTLRITTKNYNSNLPSLLVRTSLSIMSEKAASSPDYDINHPVGSGPYKVLERVEGSEVRLERFDDYFGGPAKTKYLSFIIEPSEPNSTAFLLNGKADIIYRVSANDGDYLKLNEAVTMYEADSTKTELLILNQKVEPIDNIKVRQAIACAIDKQNIVDNVLSGYGRPQSSILPSPLPGYEDYTEYTYDPERAKTLLAEAGYPDGFDFTVLTFDSQRKKLMEYLKLDFAKVNIHMNYEFLELADYLDLIEEGKQMGSVMSWTSNADPDSTLTQLYSKAGHPTVNQNGYSDPRVEELLIQGRRETDLKKLDDIYKEANTIIASNYGSIPLYHPIALVAARKEIGGVRINPQGLFGYENLYRK